jgi:phosphoserine phosphatase RsbU/P
MTNNGLLRSLILTLFVIVVIYQTGSFTGIVTDSISGNQECRVPFEFGYRMRDISGLFPEGGAAGVRLGHRLVEVEGRPFSNIRVLREAVEKKHPGDELSVIVCCNSGQEFSATVTLAPLRSRPPSLGEWLIIISINLILPVSCVFVAFWVAFIRPEDHLAWLLLGMMITFSQVGDFVWHWPWRTAAFLWGTAFGDWLVLPIWLLLFGLYFPDRSSVDRKFPWLKYFLIVPLAVLYLIFLIFHVGQEFSFDAIAWLRTVLIPLSSLRLILGVVAVAGYVLALLLKTRTTSRPDARRRLRLLWVGTLCSLLPSICVVIASLMRDTDPFRGIPEWATVPALLCLLLFPITLAYVIVVQRALDVRVALRTSVKYALARGGLLLARITLFFFAGLATAKAACQADSTKAAMFMGVAVLAGLLVIRRKFFDTLSLWMDRRFFREAYNAEQVLSDLSSEVRDFVDVERLLQTVVTKVATTLHVPHISVLLRDDTGHYSAIISSINMPLPSLPPSSKPIVYLQQCDRPVLVYLSDAQSWMNEVAHEHREILKNLNAELLLPLSGRSQLLGVVVLGSKRSEEPYSSTDLQLLETLAKQTGLALENARLVAAIAAETAKQEKLHHELEIAREVQDRLFPQEDVLLSGIECCGKCRPAQVVGGDYYDFLRTPTGNLAIAIADVAGKGISAALLMASLQASLRGQLMPGPHQIAMVMRNVNRLVYELSAANRYATVFYCEYDPETRVLEYVNAGHNAPFLLRDGTVQRLQTGGAAVGLFLDMNYESTRFPLQRGDLLLAFTDGITEALDVSGDEWGELRLLQAIENCVHLSGQQVIGRVFSFIESFTSGAPQYDDMTLVALKVS